MPVISAIDHAGSKRVATVSEAINATALTDMTFLAGVHRAESWSATAGITITLNAQHQDNAS